MIESLDYIPPPHNGLDIIYKDADLIILNKPTGLLSVPGRGPDKQDCLLSRLQLEFPTALTVHRLDMPTSGLIIYALNKTTQINLSKAFEKKTIHKSYIAVGFGVIKNSQDIINQPLLTDWPNRPKQKIDYKNGKPSLTRYKLLEITKSGNSIVQLFPITGRSHQLRVHLSSIGHPILGDEFYGTQASRKASKRLLLHADSLRFKQPESGATIDVKCRADFI